MGDAQSAQRDDTAAEEQSAVEDAPSEEDQLIKNNGQISDTNSKPGVNGHCEDQIAEKAIILQNKGTLETEHKEINYAQFTEKELPDANEEEEIINMDAKQNDLNESFRRFFSNIGLKLTVKKGSGDKTEDETEKDAVEETASETKYEDIENTNVIQDNDSTTCPTMTVTPEDVSAALVEQKTKDPSDNVDEANATMDEDANQTKDGTLDGSNPEEEIVSPIKRFFTTGIFSSLQKKKKKDEEVEKELVDMSKTDEATEQQVTEENNLNVEAQVENQSKDVPEEVTQTIETTEASGKSPSTDQDSETEITSSQEKVQGSPFKRLLSGSFRRRSKRQKRRSSDGKLSDSKEQIAEHFEASTESAAEQQVITEAVESPPTPSPPPPPPAEDPQEELSAWEAFKKLMTPKKTLKRLSLSSDEAQVPAAEEEPKPSEGERVSDHSTEEGRKRSHSWEAVLCGSGRRRSRKTSDSEDEQKQDDGNVVCPNEEDVVTSTPKQTESPSDSESSTWKSFKKLVTPKRKVKEEEESKDIVQSDNETTQEESLFSIKKLFPSRKKAKSSDRPDQLSSDEAEKEFASMDEDSETPAVVPLSEFDKSETEAVLQTDVESQATEDKLQEESEQEEILEIPKTFVQEVQEHQVTPVVTASNQEQDELTEFSKYQQLSDIPEEGAITETMATSFTEEVAKDEIADDTIAEDLVELTSEAITAPEPVDITMADETEELMLSAVSQLSESTKTSGNATPVPVEYDVEETEILLKQVIETISESPEADTICSEEQIVERVAGSVSHQILRSVTEEQNVLEIHAQDAVETGLQIDKLDDVDEIAAESLSEFKDAISTEFVSEVSKEEFESAKIDIDEVHTTPPEECIKTKAADDTEVAESISEAAEFTDEEEELIQDEVSLLESQQKEAVDQLIIEQSQIQEEISSDIELQREETDTTEETSKEDTIQEEAIKELVEEPAKIDQEEAAVEIVAAERDTELEIEVTEKLSDEAATGELQEAADKLKDAVEDKVSAEDDADIDRKQGLLDTKENYLEHKLEDQEMPEEVVQTAKDQESVPITDLVMEEQSIADTVKDGNEQEASDEANKEEESTVEQESKEVPDDTIHKVASLEVADAIIQSLEGISEGEIKEEIVPSLEEEMKEEVIHQQRDEPKEDVSEKLEEQDSAKEECDENKLASQESPDDQQNESLPEDIPEAQTGNVIASTTNENQTEVISQLDQTVDENHTSDMPLEEQIQQVDNNYEVADNIEKLYSHISSVHEETGTAQVLEDTTNLEKAPEIHLVTTEELEHEVHIGEVEVNLEGQKEDEIPCTETEIAEVEHAALLQETTCTPQNVTTTMPDLVIQKTIEDSEKISAETSIPCVDNAEELDEPEHEMHASEVEVADLHGEKEEEIVPPETSSVEIQHSVTALMTTCSFKDVASGIPEVQLETTTKINEPMFETVTSEQEDRETIETTTPLEVNTVTEMAQESDTVVLMHASSVQFEDNNRIKVQKVNVDIQSAETRVDTMLEVGVQEAKEVVNICHLTVEKVDTLAATSEIEQAIVTEENEVAIQEVVQHEKEAAPEMPKSEDELEDEDQSSDLVESKLSEEPPKTIETPDQKLAVPTLHDTIAPLKEQVILMDEEIKEPQTQQHTVQNQVATPSNAAVAVPQNTGIISSFGNIESPSSLSLEFKLNIQFGHTMVPPPPTSPLPAAPTVARSDSVKPTEMSEVGVQAVEEVILPTKQENAAQKSEIETKLAEAAVQATEPMLEPDSVDAVVIRNEPVLMDVGIQSSETEEQGKPIETALASNQPILIDDGIQSANIAEPEMEDTPNKPVVDDGTQLLEKVEQVEEVKTIEIAVTENQPILMDTGNHLSEIVAPTEEIKYTQVVIPSIQEKEPVKPIEKTEIILTQQVVFEMSEPIKQTEDEDENQDVWMDAEEDIDHGSEQTKMPLCEIEESLESQPDYFQESKTEFTESYEDFAVPLEDPQIQTAITTIE